MSWSLLSITGDALPPNMIGDYAQRGIVMSLSYIDQAKRQRRTINGQLRDVSRAQFRKAVVTISCSDVESPQLFEVSPGALANVICVPELGTNGTDTDGNPVQLSLSMMVADWQVTRDENNADTGWQMTLQEV